MSKRNSDSLGSESVGVRKYYSSSLLTRNEASLCDRNNITYRSFGQETKLPSVIEIEGSRRDIFVGTFRPVFVFSSIPETSVLYVFILSGYF